MGGSCSTHGEDEKIIHCLNWKIWREETPWKT